MLKSCKQFIPIKKVLFFVVIIDNNIIIYFFSRKWMKFHIKFVSVLDTDKLLFWTSFSQKSRFSMNSSFFVSILLSRSVYTKETIKRMKMFFSNRISRFEEDQKPKKCFSYFSFLIGWEKERTTLSCISSWT